MNRPIAIEIGIAEEIKLRGHEWQVDGPPVLFVHDLGQDLDAWGAITKTVAAQGFRVMSVDLRGHGLSDGVADPQTLVGDIQALVAQAAEHWGPVGYVGCGAAALSALYLDPEEGARVQVLVTPSGAADIGWEQTTAAMRMLIVGAGDADAYAFANEIYTPIRGQKLWVSSGVQEQGTELLLAQPHLVEEVVTFLRRYLIGFHLAWVAEHATKMGLGEAE